MNGLLILCLCAATASDDAFTRFDRWAKQYRSAEGEYQRAALEDEGVMLARTRRDAMTALMRSDPDAALARRASRDAMPNAVAAELELPLSGIGQWEVLGVLKPNHEGGIERYIVIGGHKYAVTASGALLGLPSRDR